MSGSPDERRRELERRWRSTGAPEDEAAWLRARVRAGELAFDRVELAAFCGHEAARLAVSDSEQPLPPQAPRTAREWTRALPAYGHQACVRAALVAARLVLPARARWAAGRDSELGDSGEVVAAIESWLADPALQRGAASVRRAAATFRLSTGASRPAYVSAAEGSLLRAADHVYAPLSFSDRGSNALTKAFRSLAGSPDVEDAAGALQEALRAVLVPWALGREELPRDTTLDLEEQDP